MLNRAHRLLPLFRLSRVYPAVFLLIGTLTAAGFAYGAPAQVTWNPVQVAQTIGGGEETPPITVTFRVSSPLANVTVFTVPAIEPFVTVEPAAFASLQPGVDYSLRLSFAVPPRAAEGLYDGTIHLKERTATRPQTLKVSITVDYRGSIPSPNATSLSRDSLQYLAGVGPGGSTLFFSQNTTELSVLQPGSILVLPPVPPYLALGFLGAISSVTSSGLQVVVDTTPAALSDVFTDASISLDRRLTADDLASTASFAAPSRLTSSNGAESASSVQRLTVKLDDLVLYKNGADQILLDGGISIDPTLQFSWRFENYQLTQFIFAFQITETSELTLKWQARGEQNVEREFAQYQWNPIVVWAAWVPVVIVPEVSFVARAQGAVFAGVEVGVAQTGFVTVGARYDNNSWDGISDFTGSFTSTGPSFSAGATVKAYAGPRFSLLLYGAAGPRADFADFGELDVDIFATPVWQIFGGLEANAGVVLEIFDRVLADEDFPLLIQYRRLVAEGGRATITIGAPGDSGGNCIPFGCTPAAYQQVYSASFFPDAASISAISFPRTNVASSGTNTITTATYTVSLSTTSKPVNGLNLINLNENIGSDNQVFFSGVLQGTIASGGKLTVTGTPFLYDPAQGNLLLDIRVSGIGGGGGIFFDARNGTAGGLFSRAMSPGTGFDNYGLVTEFTVVVNP